MRVLIFSRANSCSGKSVFSCYFSLFSKLYPINPAIKADPDPTAATSPTNPKTHANPPGRIVGTHTSTSSNEGLPANGCLIIKKYLSIIIRPLAKINRTGKMPIPQQKITLVGWASCPSHQLMKRIFARGLLHHSASSGFFAI
ncbi:hypothetical protein Q5692_15440 [Microcoleus sp. C2C3]|uniref:hypothetical protein n=2 Tax=Microcoleus TaxID=44471 RepID=UPI002FD2A410